MAAQQKPVFLNTERGKQKGISQNSQHFSLSFAPFSLIRMQSYLSGLLFFFDGVKMVGGGDWMPLRLNLRMEQIIDRMVRNLNAGAALRISMQHTISGEIRVSSRNRKLNCLGMAEVISGEEMK